MKEVQSIILNLSFPKSLEEILEIQKAVGYFDIEVLEKSVINNIFNYSWTVAKWNKPDDIVFFMHSKSSINTITRLDNQLKVMKGLYKKKDAEIIQNGLERGRKIYSKYGGKIFAVGRIDSHPVYEDPSDLDYSLHWRGKIYAYINDIVFFKKPIDLSEFNSFIALSRGGSITPVYGEAYKRLKGVIKSKNSIPAYLEETVAMPIPLSRINKDNWIQVASKYRYNFIYESQFRAFYVDYFLKCLGDKKGIYSECACKKADTNQSYIDNVILFNGYYLPVEVKLIINAEEDIIRQVEKYCDLDVLYLNKKENKIAPKEKTCRYWVLIIDTKGVYLFSYKQREIIHVSDLDNIKDESDIVAIRKTVKKMVKC